MRSLVVRYGTTPRCFVHRYISRDKTFPRMSYPFVVSTFPPTRCLLFYRHLYQLTRTSVACFPIRNTNFYLSLRTLSICDYFFNRERDTNLKRLNSTRSNIELLILSFIVSEYVGKKKRKNVSNYAPGDRPHLYV